MVQSPRENKTLKNALDAMKNTPIPVAVRTVDTGIGMKLPYIESSTVGEVAGKFSKASTAAKDDAYQLAHGHSKLEGSNKTSGVGNNSSRTDEIGIEFKRNRKHNEDEFIRQLKNQEDGLGKLTVYEFI